MNEIALSAWRVDESGLPSGGSIEEKLRFIEITTLHAPPITVSAPDLPYPQSSSDNHLYGDPEYPWDAYIQSWNSIWNPIPIANPP